MEDGARSLTPLLAPLGFTFRILHKGESSGGAFCQAEFTSGNRRIELHFRHGLGLVRYHIGHVSASHGAYMEALGVKDAGKHPGPCDDSIDGFRRLGHDLALTQEDFLRGDGTILAEASALETNLQAQQQRQSVIDSVGDRQARSQAREAFRNKKYTDVVRLLRGLQYPEDLSPAEKKLLRIARKKDRRKM